MRLSMSHGLIQQCLRVLLGCLVGLAVPAAMSAQERTPITPDLIVTVRDESGAPLPGLTVQIRAGADTPALAQARTDAHGQVTFANISVGQVRVSVTGTLATGHQLEQPGADAPGVALFLGPPPTTLDLRVDTHGMVLPDPSTMIDPIPNGPPIATPAPGPDGDGRILFPTSATDAPRVAATAVALDTASSMTSSLPSSPAPVAPPAAAGAELSAPAASLLEWLLGIIGAVLVVVGGLLVLTFLGRRQT